MCVVVAMIIPAHGQQVSQEDARNRASQFMKDHGIGTQAAATPADVARVSRGSSRSGPAYYVYNNNENNGFVVVSGDERTVPILGYSDKRAFESANVPEGLRFMLNQYAAEMESLDKNSVAKASAGSSREPVIYPILSTEWGQFAPFNFQCPQIDSYNCVSGCVATAMAQVMYYYQWPVTTSKSIPSYTKDESAYEALPITSFDWDAMRFYYSKFETEETSRSNAAIAKLMRYCGQSVEMKYGINESSAYSRGEIFVDYFRFSPRVRQLYRCDYSSSEWEAYIKNELAANRPIIFSGSDYYGGHCFVCDGYEGGYYHINWGWYGDGDGYFLLSLLNPGDNYSCSIEEEEGYNKWQRIIIGLEPDTVPTNEKNSVTNCYNLSVEEYYCTRDSSSAPFAITVSARYGNVSTVTRTYDMGWGVYQDDGFTLCHIFPAIMTDCELYGNYGINLEDTLYFGENFADGIYYLRPMSRESGDAVWKPCHNSGNNFIRATIEGDTLTLTAVNNGDIKNDLIEPVME